MGQGTDTVALYVDESQVIFELGDRRLTSLKLEGAYPDYQQLIPRQFARTVTIERKRLISSLERVAVLADRENSLVKFTLDGEQGQLFLSVESKDLGSAKESMSAEIVGEDLEIAFNIKYLMDGLKALPSTDIQMQLNEENQPVIFTPLGGLKMTYLVMPVQIIR
jgi:DNA polymerase-3 subunit beta